MSKISFIVKAKNFIFSALKIQLFMSVISFPILISWGLPISLMSPIGNILFTPVLSLFLLISSLIFFFELFLIPNEFLISCLEQITNLWFKMLHLGNKNWLITFPKPHNLILIFIPLLAFLILHNKKLNNFKNYFLSFSLMILTLSVFLKLIPKQSETENIALGNNNIKIIYQNNKITLEDLGALNISRSPNSWIEYTLISHIIKNYGHREIENLIIKNINWKTIKAIKCLIEKAYIKQVTLIKNKDINYTLCCELELIDILENKNIKLNII